MITSLLHVRIVFILSAGALFFWLSCTESSAPGTASVLLATRLKGTAEIRSELSQSWGAITTNQSIVPASLLRTGPDSFIELKSASLPHRVVLAADSEVSIDRWMETTAPGNEEMQIDVRRGLTLVDVPAFSTASKFEVKGSNFVASVRTAPTIAAISGDGNVLVQVGNIVCVWIVPGGDTMQATTKATTLTAGQMANPTSQTPRPIPSSSNHVWNFFPK